MTKVVSHFEEINTQHRQMRPTDTATAQAIDQHRPWQRIPVKAIDDCHVKSAAELARLIEAKQMSALYNARRFKELRCPICGLFVCAGC